MLHILPVATILFNQNFVTIQRNVKIQIKPAGSEKIKKVVETLTNFPDWDATTPSTSLFKP